MDLQKIFAAQICPVYGFQLGFMPWHDDSASDEICPCCGIQFGYTDAAGGIPMKREEAYSEWRRRWVNSGKLWTSANPVPDDYDPDTQLKNLSQLMN